MIAFLTRWRRMTLAIVALAAALTLCAAVLDLAIRFSPIDPRPYLSAMPSPTLLDRQDRLLHASLNAEDSWSFPKDLSQHSRYLIEATIAAEDQRFWLHNGVDLLAIGRAAMQNAAERRVASGASTITMQVVKLEGRRSRSVLAKAVQAWDALRLERSAQKYEILTAYLNKAPYGYNLIGAEAASLRYFGKSTAELTLSEAALLAAIPKAPGRLDPLRNPASSKARRDHVLRRMHAEGFIDERQLAQALKADITARWNDLPMLAPHLARLGTEASMATTLDLDIQRGVQDAVRRHLKQFNGAITNAAAIAVDVETAEVLAYCGSSDFFKSDGGQMDLARAVRSPGSALKPFIYSLALQNNVLYPEEMLLDDTLDYGDYTPANYDGKYTGLLPAHEALRYSLNVPAIQVLDRVGVSDFHETLRSLGFSTIDRPPAHYGLGLALGNCGVRLDETAAAYRALAGMGEYVPIQYLRSAGATAPRRVFREDVAAAALEMLRQPLPKELPDALVQAGVAREPVAWKTGTSTGHHDAWAVVFNRHYVVAVWLGNADGRSSARLVGAEVAVPLAGRIFRDLPRKVGAPWPDLTQTLRHVTACASSGLPVVSDCPSTRIVSIPAGAYLNRRCDVHRPQSVLNETIHQWPGAALHFDLAKVVAPITVDASHELVRSGLKITSPANASEYVVTEQPGADRIRLRASMDYDQPLHWYCDGVYIGVSHREAPAFLELTAGEHLVACMAENGATDSVRIKVHEAR